MSPSQETVFGLARNDVPVDIPSREGDMSATRPVSILVILFASALLASPSDLIGTVQDGTSPIIDAKGRRIGARPSSFDRIVSLVPSATDLLVSIGATDRLIGRTSYDSAPAVIELPSVGEPLTPALERMVELDPDLVIAWRELAGRPRGSRMEALFPAVYYARTTDLGGVRRLLDDLGRILGRPAAADSLRRVIDCQLDSVYHAVRGDTPVRAAYLVWPDPPTAAGPGSYVDSLLHRAGGRNVFSGTESQWPRVSLESLVAADPEVLVLGEIESGSPGWEAVSERPGWRSLAAVQSGRIRVVSSDLFHRPGPEVGRAAAVLARHLHPGTAIPDLSTCVPPPETTGG